MDTHRAVLEAAKRKLSDLMKKLGPDALQLLLQYSFPYIGVPELRDIPLAVLGQLQPVPPDFLRQLSTDKELFADLPTSVQIQVTFHQPKYISRRGMLAGIMAHILKARHFKKYGVLWATCMENISGYKRGLRPIEQPLKKTGCQIFTGQHTCQPPDKHGSANLQEICQAFDLETWAIYSAECTMRLPAIESIGCASSKTYLCAGF